MLYTFEDVEKSFIASQENEKAKFDSIVRAFDIVIQEYIGNALEKHKVVRCQPKNGKTYYKITMFFNCCVNAFYTKDLEEIRSDEYVEDAHFKRYVEEYCIPNNIYARRKNSSGNIHEITFFFFPDKESCDFFVAEYKNK